MRFSGLVFPTWIPALAGIGTISFLFGQDQPVSPVQDVKQVYQKREKLPPALDTLSRGWGTMLIFTASFQQISLQNWLLGGEDQITGTILLDFYPVLRAYRFRWDQAYFLRFGIIQKNGSQPWETTQDLVEILQSASFSITEGSTRWAWTSIGHFRTSMLNFLAPGWLVLSAGVSFAIPRLQASFYGAPIAGKLTFVLQDSLSRIGAFGVDTGRTTRSELGMYLLSRMKWVAWKNRVILTGRLDLFAPYSTFGETFPDFHLETLLTFKPLSWLALTFQIRLFYDDDMKLPALPESPENARAPLQWYVLYGLGLHFSWKHVQTPSSP